MTSESVNPDQIVTTAIGSIDGTARILLDMMGHAENNDQEVLFACADLLRRVSDDLEPASTPQYLRANALQNTLADALAIPEEERIALLGYLQKIDRAGQAGLQFDPESVRQASTEELAALFGN